jgi:hypothetical protein
MKTGLLLLLPVALWGQRAQLPEFVAGDQCLFCHRNDIGPGWQKNRHNLTVQAMADGVGFTLGARQQRELKKSGYGRFAMREADGTWNDRKFNVRCAGCHTTAVNGSTLAFTEFSIDCYACHGVVDLEHSNDTSLMLLAKKNKTAARVVVGICGSCHLRGGVSKAKGLPYPYQFVPGDDLFADFVPAEKAPAADVHVYTNIRQIVQNNSDVTCLNCHSVHGGSSARHRRVLTSVVCLDCHYASGPKNNVKPYAAASPLCEY